jgi:L-rhamnose isomerase
MDQKLEYLEDANQILSESINVDSDRNWFAYTTRMQVGLDIADSVIKHNQERAKSSLENARKDGHICFKSRYALLNASRGFCKYSLNSGLLLSSKVCSPD